MLQQKGIGLKMTKQTMFHFLAALLVLSLFSGCAVSNKFGPYIGKVVDAESKEPIEGAVVFMECFTLTANPGGATGHYAGFRETLTDEHGEFHLELRVNTFKPGHLWDYDSNLKIFKPGYGVFPSHPDAYSDIPRSVSYTLPVNTFATIALPKLKTLKERKRNLRSIYISSIEKVPLEERKNVLRLENIERVEVGLKPYGMIK